MTSVALAASLLLAVPGKPGTSQAPADDWDLRWMVAAPAAPPVAPQPRETSALRALGRTLYQQRCAACHGDKGDGAGPHAARLVVPPTSFTRGVYKLRSTPTGSIPTDADLFGALTRGIHGTPMLPWTALSEQERWALVYQLKSFSVRFREERPARPVRVPAPPKEDRQLRERGAELYGKLLCVRCHGEQGAGDGAAARAYAQTFSRDVRVRDFTRGRFIRGAEMEDIYLTLRVGIEGTPMAAYDTLRDDELWALAAYVRALVRQRPLHDFPAARTHAKAGEP
jgi:mono/diheme cytochrome c family protein